ncbi:MAG TPA: hypothetical protein VMS73_10130 [Anaerolineaceae bacterium]|nr:hypothetical protein [Anaerolineaceae bacterium]
MKIIILFLGLLTGCAAISSRETPRALTQGVYPSIGITPPNTQTVKIPTQSASLVPNRSTMVAGETVSPALLPPPDAWPNNLTAKIEWKGQPLQPYLLLQGTLANSCQDWAVYANPPDDHSNVVVSVAVNIGITTGTCSENEVPIQREVLLGPFDPGTYTVYVNTTVAGKVTIKQNK